MAWPLQCYVYRKEDIIMAGKILIVEDNELMIEVMTYILYNQGYDVISSTRAELVFDHIKANRPDLVILDTQQAGMDSQEVCRLIKLNIATRKLPVIICSENEENDAILHHKGAPDGILHKPFGMNNLIRTVQFQLAA